MQVLLIGAFVTPASQATIAADRTRQAEDVDKALAAAEDGLRGLTTRLDVSSKKQDVAREAESRKCQLELEFLEQRKARTPSSAAERDALVVKLKADHHDMVAKQIMTKEASDNWYHKQVVALYGWAT